MSSPEEPTSEIKMSPEDLIAQLTATAQSSLSDTGVPSSLQPDGSSIRDVDTDMRITTSDYQPVGLSEVTPGDGGLKKYSYSFVTRERDLNPQYFTRYLTWKEGDSTITHGVRSSLDRSGELQVLGKIAPTPEEVASLESSIGYLMHNYDRINSVRSINTNTPQRVKARHFGRLARRTS